MCSEVNEGPWHFKPVIDLIYSLSARGQDHNTQASPRSSDEFSISPSSPVAVGEQSLLGNFDKLWTFLGQPLDRKPPEVSIINELDLKPLPREVLSIETSNGKAVRWLDEVKTNTEDKLNGCLSDYLPLTRTQKKAERRKKKHEEDDDDDMGIAENVRNSSGRESKHELRIVRQSADRTAVIQEILHGKSAEVNGLYPALLPDSGKLSLSSRFSVDNRGWPAAEPFYPERAKPCLSVEKKAGSVTALRKARLLKLLYARFPEDRGCLGKLSDVHYTKRRDKEVASQGLHVFVDTSNIMIGFQNHLKAARGIPVAGSMKRQPFSFHNFSLILERGRPTVKRVLVGSDNFPAIQEAKAIGYQTNILDRVRKARELTPRQIKYRHANNGTGTSGASSGSETNAIAHAREKWGEQAVDEILHLKILESIVDAKEPSTIVLATGDAAEAEYSEGFLKMVERALEKGWKVELVSFRHNISGMYRRKEFRTRWDKMFCIIELDEFAEELLGS